MHEDTKVVETNGQTATTDTTGAGETVQEVDYAAIIAEKDAELAKTREERENYRKGMLKAKGKVEDDDGTETDEERMRRIVQEELLTTKEAQLYQERKNAEAALIKENNELRLALKNKPGTSTATGSSTGRDEQRVDVTAADKFFSEAQIAELKKKGLDPEQVLKNLRKQSAA